MSQANRSNRRIHRFILCNSFSNRFWNLRSISNQHIQSGHCKSDSQALSVDTYCRQPRSPLQWYQSQSCCHRRISVLHSSYPYCRHKILRFSWYVLRNSALTDRYMPGVYTFVMQMYTMELCHSRRLAKAYKSYSREIILEIDKNRGFFELKRTKMTPKKYVHP